MNGTGSRESHVGVWKQQDVTVTSDQRIVPAWRVPARVTCGSLVTGVP